MDVNPRIKTIGRDQLIDNLQRHATDYYCGEYISVLSGIELTQLYQELETERVERKYLDLVERYEYVGKDWNQTMFVMILRYLSDKYNKENFMEIAYRIGYKTMMAERTSIEDLEALLLATSGLIGLLPIDPLTDSMRKRGAHLLLKYSITPLSIKQWQTKNRLATRDPIIRLMQAAQLIFSNDMLFNKVISCRTRRDILALFDTPAREVWMPYFGSAKSRNIGAKKRDLFGINVVIPILYSFGHLTSDDELIDAANDLNESIPAEENYFITGWKNHGVTPQSAYDSQALIQLASEYCLVSEENLKRRKQDEQVLSRCEECPLFKHICSSASAIERIPRFLESF